MNMAAVLSGVAMIGIGLWQLLDRSRLGSISARAFGEYFRNRQPGDDAPDAEVKPFRKWYALEGVGFLILGIIALVSGLT